MRIGIDARLFSDAFTGIGRSVYELTKRLTALRPDWQWVLFMNDPEASKATFPPNTEIIRVNAPHYSWAEQTHFVQALKDAQCDLVHFMHFNVPLAFFGRKVPSLVTLHDLTLHRYPGPHTSWVKKLAYRLVIRSALARASGIVCVSASTQNELQRLYPRYAARTHTQVIHNGTTAPLSLPTPAEKQALRTQYNLPDRYLLYTGNWRVHKNIPTLIQAFSAAASSLHPSTHLVLTGTPAPADTTVTDALHASPVSERILTPGHVSAAHLHALYACAHAYVFPSLYEGFGLPPLEAMSYGLPVATSNTTSMPEVCGDAALYFPPESVSEMSKQIIRISEDQALRDELRAKGFARQQAFSWDTAADQLITLYEQCA